MQNKFFYLFLSVLCQPRKSQSKSHSEWTMLKELVEKTRVMDRSGKLGMKQQRTERITELEGYVITKKIFLRLLTEPSFWLLCHPTYLEKCFHMLSRCIFFENRIGAFPHHIIYCFHDIKHFLKRKKNYISAM